MTKIQLHAITELWAALQDAAKTAIKIDSRLVFWYYATAIVGAVAPLGAAYLLKLLIDQLATGAIGSLEIAGTILVAYFLMVLVEIVLYWGLNVAYFDYLLRNRIQIGLTQLYTAKMASLDLEHLENAEIQTLIAKVDETYQWQIPDFLRTLGYVLTNVSGILAAIFLLLPFGWWLPLIVIVLSLPRVYFKIRHGNFTWAMFASGAPQVKKLWYMSGLLASRDSILETRVFRSQPAILKRMNELHESLYQLNKKPLDRYKWVLIVGPIVEVSAVLLLLQPLLLQTAAGALSLGSLALVIATLGQLRSQTSLFAANIGDAYQHSLFVKPFFELLNLPRLITHPDKPHRFAKIKPPTIEFKNVSFTYPTGNQVLKNVSFTIQPGESVALVGVNGAGKSTIIKLLCRFYDVSEGEILINGKNIKSLDLDNWYEHMATLFQHFVKYNFSVRDNIMLGKPGVNDEARMLQAAKQAGAHTFITKLPQQYDQILGYSYDQGIDLSGGQWQKIAVARALYQAAPLLIMDEPTSAIDAHSEAEIFKNLENAYQNKALILVSHRFSTVRKADKIIVIENGEIIEQGTHARLLKKAGTYAKLFNAQASEYL